MSIAFKIGLFGGILSIPSMIVIILDGFQVITIGNTMRNCIGASAIIGIFLLGVGLIKVDSR